MLQRARPEARWKRMMDLSLLAAGRQQGREEQRARLNAFYSRAAPLPALSLSGRTASLPFPAPPNVRSNTVRHAPAVHTRLMNDPAELHVGSRKVAERRRALSRERPGCEMLRRRWSRAPCSAVSQHTPSALSAVGATFGDRPSAFAGLSRETMLPREGDSHKAPMTCFSAELGGTFHSGPVPS